MSPRDPMRDPRNQPDGSHDQDRHGRKQNRGSNQDTRRELGSAREPAGSGTRDEQARRGTEDGQP